MLLTNNLRQRIHRKILPKWRLKNPLRPISTNCEKKSKANINFHPIVRFSFILPVPKARNSIVVSYHFIIYSTMPTKIQSKKNVSNYISSPKRSSKCSCAIIPIKFIDHYTVVWKWQIRVLNQRQRRIIPKKMKRKTNLSNRWTQILQAMKTKMCLCPVWIWVSRITRRNANEHRVK